MIIMNRSQLVRCPSASAAIFEAFFGISAVLTMNGFDFYQFRGVSLKAMGSMTNFKCPSQ